MVEALAAAPLPPPAPCDDEYFLKSMTVMQASLPRRASDDLSGDVLVDAYKWKLGGQPRSAISYLTGVALERCKWFPTIAECLEIISGWTRSDDAPKAKHRATILARNERQARLDETIAALERGELDGAAIAALPEQTRRIAVTLALVWCEPDGSYRPRPLRRPEEAPADLAAVEEALAEKWPSARSEAA